MNSAYAQKPWIERDFDSQTGRMLYAGAVKIVINDNKYHDGWSLLKKKFTAICVDYVNVVWFAVCVTMSHPREHLDVKALNGQRVADIHLIVIIS